MTKRRVPLCVEELGPRIVPASLSTMPVAAPPTMESFAIMHQPLTENALAGHGQGTYVRMLVPGGMGGQYRLQGSATLSQLGSVTVTGAVRTAGFIGHGYATGTLTFSNAHGSVTLDLRGTQKVGFSSLPNQFQFQVVSGTGNYTNFTDQGTLQFAINATGNVNGTFSFSI